MILLMCLIYRLNFLLRFFQYPQSQIILPAAQKPLSINSSGASDAGSVSGSSVNAPSPAPSNASNNASEQPPLRPLGKLEDMKGIDLIRTHHHKSSIICRAILLKTFILSFLSERLEGGIEEAKPSSFRL